MNALSRDVDLVRHDNLIIYDPLYHVKGHVSYAV
jgi:hypothetical protein